MTDDQRLEATIHGLVQGVFFRHNTRIEAIRLGLAGSVRNLPDGTVGVIAEGPRKQLDRFLAWLRQGPELAVVERVDVEWKETAEIHTTFRIDR